MVLFGGIGDFLADCSNRYLNCFLLQQGTTYSLVDVKPLTWSKKVASDFFSCNTVALGASKVHPEVAYHVNVYIFGTRMGPEKLSLVHADEDNFLGLKLGHIHADPRS